MTVSSFVPPNELLALAGDGSCSRMPVGSLWGESPNSLWTNNGPLLSLNEIVDPTLYHAVVSCGTIVASLDCKMDLNLLVEMELRDGSRVRQAWENTACYFNRYSFRSVLFRQIATARSLGSQPSRVHCNGAVVWGCDSTVQFGFLDNLFVSGFPAPIDKVQEVVNLIGRQARYTLITVSEADGMDFEQKLDLMPEGKN